MSWVHPILKHLQFTRWKWLPVHPKNITIGQGVDIGAMTVLLGHQGIVLEDNVQLGPGVKLLSVSSIDGKQGEIRIKRNACVGANSVVMPGITIGENSVVGALSFVNQNIPDNEMWFGIPATFHKIITKKDIPFLE